MGKCVIVHNSLSLCLSVHIYVCHVEFPNRAPFLQQTFSPLHALTVCTTLNTKCILMFTRLTVFVPVYYFEKSIIDIHMKNVSAARCFQYNSSLFRSRQSFTATKWTTQADKATAKKQTWENEKKKQNILTEKTLKVDSVTYWTPPTTIENDKHKINWSKYCVFPSIFRIHLHSLHKFWFSSWQCVCFENLLLHLQLVIR